MTGSLYTQVKEITAHNYLDEVEKAPPSVSVVVHMYDYGREDCDLVSAGWCAGYASTTAIFIAVSDSELFLKCVLACYCLGLVFRVLRLIRAPLDFCKVGQK